MPTTTATAPAAATIAAALAGRPDGATVRELAEDSGLSASTVAKTLTAMREAGTANRTLGQGKGNRKAADTWHATTDQPAADQSATDQPTGEVAADEDTPNDTSTATDTAPTDTDEPTNTDDEDNNTADSDVPGSWADIENGPSASDDPDYEPAAMPDTDPADTDPAPVPAAVVLPAAEPAPAEASVSAPPAGPRQPDLKVLIMAGVLGDHPDGVSAHEAITASGLAPGVGDTILAAMEVAGAARRLPVADDGTELWVRGDGDLAAVDPANAPTHVTCPTCGHTRRVRRPSATARRANTGRPAGRTTGDINSDGSAKLAKGGLQVMVEGFMRKLGTGHQVTPGTVGRELGGRSPGAVGNAMNRLTNAGILVMTCPAPAMYALADDAPAPGPDVRAHLTAVTPATTDTDTDANDTTGEAPAPVAALAA